ncbi:BrnA antitoxin family protein [Notoacmeibacter marinus]|uniref:BrnA antitoxin family protein n=1 Tax=Notoacmeibacter marinus TaxID=1876515 RepID=UPI001FE068D8|nr:BrnA antitoxin family protein [Notoacmeibacter marinus]
MFPELAESIKRSRGRPKKENAKTAVTVRLDPRTLERWQAKEYWRTEMAKLLEEQAPD